MGTKNTIYVISGGVNYYLSGGAATQTPYSGSGSPWTSEATTPYELSLNDVAGAIYVPHPAPRQTIYGGGPPFMNGRQPVYQSFDQVTEQVGVQLKATTKDNAIALLIQLRTILNTALFSAPAVLVVQGGTNAGYFEVLSADVDESELYLQEPDGDWRVVITWTRTPYATRASLVTCLNAVTFTNTGTPANSNFQSLGTIAGDLASSIGQPMRVTLSAPSTSGAFVGYIAIAKASTYTAHATSITTNSTTGIDVATATFTHPADDEGTALRFIGRFASPSSNLEVRAVVKINAVLTIYTTPQWIAPGTPSGAYIDLGYIKLPRNLRRAKSVAVTCTIQARSTDGSATSGTLSYSEIIQYYTWLQAEVTFPATSVQLEIVGADSSVGGYVREITPPLAWLSVTVSGAVTDIAVTAGSFPRAFTGAGLYMAWTFAGSHSTTATFNDVTAQNAALYQTVRGNT